MNGKKNVDVSRDATCIGVASNLLSLVAPELFWLTLLLTWVDLSHSRFVPQPNSILGARQHRGLVPDRCSLVPDRRWPSLIPEWFCVALGFGCCCVALCLGCSTAVYWTNTIAIELTLFYPCASIVTLRFCWTYQQNCRMIDFSHPGNPISTRSQYYSLVRKEIKRGTKAN